MSAFNIRLRWSLALTAFVLGSFDAPAFSASIDPGSGDIFSTPDTHVAPTFGGRLQTQQQPAAVNAAPDPPDREALLSIPSITPPQRTQINNLYQQSGSEMHVLQGQLESLRRSLNQKRAQDKARRNQAQQYPSFDPSMQSTSSMQAMMSDLDLVPGRESFAEDSEESINAHIEATNQQIKESRLALWRNCQALLSPEQMCQLQTMQHGKLFIASNGSTDISEPVPAVKQQPLGSHRPQSTPQRFPSPVPKSVVLNTTKQLLYRVLWRL
jgi:hypothetical protein